MSGAAIGLEAGPVGLAGRGRATAAVAERPLPFAVELGLFALIAAFSMALWARLVEPSSADRQALALLVVAAGAIALQLLARIGSRGGRRTLSITVAFATVIGALVAAGLPAHLLAPAQWGELRTQIQGGMGGIEQAELPYAGSDPWIRLTLVLGAPALVALAGMIAFWPAGRRGPARTAALAVLLIAYGIAATLDNPGAEAFWGIVLLVLAVAWLWAPRLQPGRRAAALAVAFGAGVLALPATAKLNGPAWWDYENWSWFGAQRTVSFDWNHSYGPLDWPREGTTVMSVDTSAPLYWKASVLDRFDGYGWQRALPGDPDAAPEVRARSSVPGGALERKHPGWVADATFELRALSSDVVIGTGLTESIDGLSGTLASGDGTLSHVGEPLERGDKYTVVAYVPQPTPDQLREAPAASSERRFNGSTLLSLPPADGVTQAPGPAVPMPLWGERDPTTTAQVLASPYGTTYRLAQSWIADARTPYDAVRAIQDHLRGDYAYDPNVPPHTYPLPSFLFDDRSGYCQQFAGTMGLMLRMVGIPARVVSGFAPGTLDPSSGTYEVHDTDAHSWVEAYFRGIGWVTFDPTPDAAPAESQRLGGDYAAEFRGPAPNPTRADVTGQSRGGRVDTTAPAPVESTSSSSWAPAGAIVLAAICLAAGTFALVVSRRRRRLRSGEQTEAQVAELTEALRRAGWRIGPRTTLLAIERRSTGSARVAIRAYAAGLRAHRFGPTTSPPPGPAERRAVRRALSAGGLRRRLRMLVSIPPGGPARS